MNATFDYNESCFFAEWGFIWSPLRLQLSGFSDFLLLGRQISNEKSDVVDKRKKTDDCIVYVATEKNQINKPFFIDLFERISAQVVPGALVLLISYLGCHIELILIVWFVAITLITAAYAGAMANVVDIAPNFAGPVLAFAQTIHMTASFLSPLAAGYILKDQVNNFNFKTISQNITTISF